MFNECCARGGTEAGDNVDDAGWETGFRQRLDEVIGRERRIFSGLDDAGIARNERGKELPTRDGHGEVPRGDEADYPDGHTDRHGEFALQLRWGRDAEQPSSPTRNVNR